MSKNFTSTDPQSHKGQSNEWLTPLDFIAKLGTFDLDPCGYPGHMTAEKLICLPRQGLAESWHGRVWLNPPYGNGVKLWLEALRDHGDGIALVFARLETNWLMPFLENGFFMIKGRLTFISPTRESTNAGTGSILIPFGRHNVGAILSSGIEGKWFQ